MKTSAGADKTGYYFLISLRVEFPQSAFRVVKQSAISIPDLPCDPLHSSVNECFQKEVIHKEGFTKNGENVRRSNDESTCL